MLRKGVAALLGETEDIKVVAETGDAEEVIALLHSLKPDIVLIDTSGLDDGISIIQKIITQFPACKVIEFSTPIAKQSVDNILSAGAMGFLLKESEPEELVEGIRTVMRGEIFLSSAVNHTVLEAYVEQILSLIHI